MKANEKYSKAVEFVKKYGWSEVKEYINNAHKKATHIYIGYMGTASYFYQHPNLNWCEVDHRTVGWDSDRCCYDVHPPVSSMFVIDDLKQLVESHELVESYGGLENAKGLVGHFKFIDCVHIIPDGLEQVIVDVESCK